MKTISISTGGSVATSAIYSQFAHLQIVGETEKAFQLQNGKMTCWIPQSALIQGTDPKGNPSDWYKIAKWFKPDFKQAKFLFSNNAISGQSA